MSILRICLFLLILLPLQAAVDGVVTNKTTGKPQTGVEVALLKLSQDGRAEVVNRATTDAAGKFVFSETLNGIHALESAYEGATYFQVIPPMLPPNNLQVAVYGSTRNADAARLDQHIYFLEPGQQQLVVSESYIINNPTQTAYRDSDKGSLRFYLPPEAKGVVQVSFIGPDQRPHVSTGLQTKTPNVLQINDPLLPGENRIDLNYVIPYEGGAGVFKTRKVMPGGRTRVVAPSGVTLEGEGLEALGVEPRTQAQIFGTAADNIAITLSGSGAISDPTEGAGAAAESEGPRVRNIRPAVYENLKLIVGAAGLALILALMLLYRRGAITRADAAKPVDNLSPSASGEKR